MSTTVTVPAGISRADSLKGLWKCSQSSKNVQSPHNRELASQLSAEKIEDYFRRNSRVYDFAGRCIQIDMSHYPKLDLRDYQKICGNTLSIGEIVEKCLKTKPVIR